MSDFAHVPIIRLEVTGMKHAISVALSEYAMKMDQSIQAALEAMCTEENVARIVSEEARRQIEIALKEEVGNFFKWSGPGRAAVREAIHEHLLHMYPESQKEASK